MARKVETLVIDAEGRDNGKKFILTEMSAWDAERWATRVLLALINAGAQIPDDAAKLGVQGLLAVGMQALSQLKADTLQPLLDQLWPCVQYQHGPSKQIQRVFTGNDCQIEEIATFWTIRAELLKLHTGFSPAGLLPT